MRSERVRRAIERAGGVHALALAVGVTPQAVSQWPEVPAKHIRAIARATGLSFDELLPPEAERPAAEMGAEAA